LTTKTWAAKTPATKTTKSLATKTRATRIKEPPPLEDLPSDRSPDKSDDESSDNESYDKSDRLSGPSDNSILDMATMLKREAYLEKLRQYYYANKETICKDQNSKYPERREKEKNNPVSVMKKRQASKKYYHQNKDKILPRIKKDILKKLLMKKVLKCVQVVDK